MAFVCFALVFLTISLPFIQLLMSVCLKKFKQERLQINQLETFNFLTVYKPYTKPYAKKNEFETFIVDKLEFETVIRLGFA